MRIFLVQVVQREVASRPGVRKQKGRLVELKIAMLGTVTELEPDRGVWSSAAVIGVEVEWRPLADEFEAVDASAHQLPLSSFEQTADFMGEMA